LASLLIAPRGGGRTWNTASWVGRVWRCRCSASAGRRWGFRGIWGRTIWTVRRFAGRRQRPFGWRSSAASTTSTRRQAMGTDAARGSSARRWNRSATGSSWQPSTRWATPTGPWTPAARACGKASSDSAPTAWTSSRCTGGSGRTSRLRPSSPAPCWIGPTTCAAGAACASPASRPRGPAAAWSASCGAGGSTCSRSPTTSSTRTPAITSASRGASFRRRGRSAWASPRCGRRPAGSSRSSSRRHFPRSTPPA